MKTRAAVIALLASRDGDATACPSEVARALATADGRPEAWRAELGGVHAEVDRMVADGAVTLSWKGRRMAPRCGPYRLSRGPRFDQGS